MMKKFFKLFAGMALTMAVAAGAMAEGELVAPKAFTDVNEPLTIVVGFAAGGGVDTAARMMAKYAQKYIPVPIVIVNQTGASGVVSVTNSLKKPANGHTLISLASGALIGDITGVAKYDYLKDLDFVALQDTVPYALSFRKDDPRFSTREEFLKYVKDHPGEITVGLSGINNANHFAALCLVRDYGYDMELVPFNGSANAKTAFLGKHVDAFCETMLETKSMMDAGQSVCVCVFGDKPFTEELPGVPTSHELGLDLKISGTSRGYAFAKGTDPAIVDFISKVIGRALAEPEFLEEYAKIGIKNCVRYMDSKTYTEFQNAEHANYKVLCDALGITKKK